MKMYVVSLGVGLLVGVIYGVLHVRSPAPPVIALVGLLGILLGEQLVPLAKRLVSNEPVPTAWAREQCLPHIFGRLPGETTETQQPRNIDVPMNRTLRGDIE
jgi:XapX domain-containing protein